MCRSHARQIGGRRPLRASEQPMTPARPAARPRRRPASDDGGTEPAGSVDGQVGVPGFRRGLVRRPVLVDRLIEADEAPLAVVVAPPGYGKSSLLCEWALRDERPFVWIALERRSADAAQLTAGSIVDAFAPVAGSSRRLPSSSTHSLPPCEALAQMIGSLAAQLRARARRCPPGRAARAFDGHSRMPEEAPRRLDDRVGIADRAGAGARASTGTPRAGRGANAGPGDGARGGREPARRRRPRARRSRRSRRSSAGPKDGRRRCIWPPSRCETVHAQTATSASEATTTCSPSTFAMTSSRPCPTTCGTS